MKLKLIINRFEETEPIEIPIIEKVEFDDGGSSKLTGFISKLKSTTKNMKLSSNLKETLGAEQFEKASNFMTQFRESMKKMTSSAGDKKADPMGLKTIAAEFTKIKELMKDISPDTLEKMVASSVSGTPVERLEKYVSIMSMFKQIMGETNTELTKTKSITIMAKDGFKKFIDTLFKTKKATDDTKKGLKGFASVMRSSVFIQVQALSHILRRAFGFMESSFTAAGDFVESINLYTMSVGNYATAGKKWAEEISNALYLDTSEIYQFTGQFFNLTRGLGASAEAADLMSRNLTQLTYDMSSYLNIDVETANNKLMSAMSGQTKAVTSVGVAVQSASLQELAYSLGIRKSVEEMTQAEKTYLRYIQIMRSTTQMQGDLGRTIITPTNAMRLLRTQLNLLSRAIGQVFTPVIMHVIPYIIAFTQVLTELAQSLARMFGYKLEDYLAPASSVKALSDNFEDLDDAASGAADSINRTLAPFDELNVVEMQGKGHGGSGADTGSVLADLEKYLTGYDMLEFYEDSVKNKVEGIKEGLKNLLPIITSIGGALATWKIAKTVYDLLSAIYNNKGGLQQKVGLTLVVTSLALNFAGAQDIKNGNFEAGMLKQLGAALGTGLGTFLLIRDVKGMTLQKQIGLSLMATSLSFTVSAALDYKNDFNAFLLNILGSGVSFGLGMLTMTKNLKLTIAVTIGYTLLSGVVAWLFGEGSQKGLIDGLKESRDEAKKVNEELSNTYDEIYKNRDANLKLVDANQKLYKELTGIVDENGKIKDGYETRAEFILNQLKDAYGIEYEIIDGQIQQYGKLKQSVEDLIAKKKLEILLEANKEAYIEALKHEDEHVNSLNKSSTKLKKAKKELRDIDTELKKKTDELTIAEIKYKAGIMSPAEYKKLQNEVNELTIKYDGQKEAVEILSDEVDTWEDTVAKDTKAIADYNDGLAASYSNDTEKINAAVDNMTNHVEGSLSKQLAVAKTKRDEIVKHYKKTNGEITDDQQKAADAQYKSVIDNLVKQSSDLKNMTPELAKAWKTLAEQDKDAFNKAIKSLPTDVRNQLTSIPNLLMNDLSPGFSNTAAKLGQIFGNNVSSNMRINKSTLESTLSTAIQNVKLPRWLKNTPMGKMAENLGFQFYARGGFPDTGEIFVANENGPEMVGKIGSKTAVANNDQIATALTNAMVNALGTTNTNKNGKTVIYIGNKKVFDGMGDYVDSENDRYGTNYIRV